MLSGVASDADILELARDISTGELVRILNLVQQTMAGFTRSESRRMDAELCLLNLCQPELSLDAKAINARLTRLEEQLRSGEILISEKKVVHEAMDSEREELPPPPGDQDAPPAESAQVPMDEPAPVGFWTDLAAAVRQELPPPVAGFFSGTPNGLIQCAVQGDAVVLRCANKFILETADRPDVLAIVARKAGAILGRKVQVKTVDISATAHNSDKMEQLLNFGRAHSEVIKIKE
jgi:DNA polymerase-3 subunit gamma/tau